MRMIKLDICEVYFLHALLKYVCFFKLLFSANCDFLPSWTDYLSCVEWDFREKLDSQIEHLYLLHSWMKSHQMNALCVNQIFQQNLIWSRILNRFRNEKSLLSENKGDESFGWKREEFWSKVFWSNINKSIACHI